MQKSKLPKLPRYRGHPPPNSTSITTQENILILHQWSLYRMLRRLYHMPKEKSKITPPYPYWIRLLVARAVSPCGHPGTQKFSRCMAQQNLHNINIPVTIAHGANPKSL
jgi:hypothetical protein